ncbi:MAG: glutathione S-transferase [Rubrivivax sp.]
MYTLYGTQGSGSAAVEAALVLAGLPFRTVRASQWEADSAQAELLTLNPLGQIPTLQLPDGSVMTESAAILAELGLRHPEAGLLPTEPSARAQALRGLVYIAANCYSAISVIDFPERWCSEADEATNTRIRAGARARLHHHWGLFADQFPAAPFLNGAAPGALDLLASVVSRWSGTRAFVKAQRPAFAALLQRIETHPQLAPVFQRHWPG